MIYKTTIDSNNQSIPTRYSNEIEGVHTENEGVRVGVGESHKLYNYFSNPDFPDSDNFLIDWDRAKLKIFIPKNSKKAL